MRQPTPIIPAPLWRTIAEQTAATVAVVAVFTLAHLPSVFVGV